jgi:hypothetical protein
MTLDPTAKEITITITWYHSIPSKIPNLSHHPTNPVIAAIIQLSTDRQVVVKLTIWAVINPVITTTPAQKRGNEANKEFKSNWSAVGEGSCAEMANTGINNKSNDAKKNFKIVFIALIF